LPDNIDNVFHKFKLLIAPASGRPRVLHFTLVGCIAWMTCKERGRVAKLTRAMHYVNNPELSSPEETRCQFNGSKADIKLGIDVHQDFYVVVEQVGGSNPHASYTACTCPPRTELSETPERWAEERSSAA